MILDGTKYRSFYPQKDLEFQFEIEEATSQNFEVGVSGNNYVYFSFKSGLVYDKSNNFIASFTKPINFNSYIQTGLWNYYINNDPVARNINVGNSSVFSSVVCKIYDGKTVNLNTNLNGSSVPELIFHNFNYTNSGLSGNVELVKYQSGSGETRQNYIARVFEASSPLTRNPWTFPSELYPGVKYSFYNLGETGISSGSLVPFQLNSSFGIKSFSLIVDAEQEISGSGFTPDTSFVSIIPLVKHNLISGESTSISNWENIYEIFYTSPSGYRLDTEFNYYQGKIGSVNVSGTFNLNADYSGTLNAVSGKASGLLYNSNLSSVQNYTWSGVDNPFSGSSAVTFYPSQGIVSAYFQDLNPTGSVSITEQSSTFKVSLNDNAISGPSRFVDLGGKTGFFTGASSNNRIYDLLTTYNSNSIYTGLLEREFSGLITSGMSGKFNFSTVNFSDSAVTIQTTTPGTSIMSSITGVSIAPYRGVAFASLSDSMIISSNDWNPNFKNWIAVSERNPILLYKNLDSAIDSKGSTTITAGTNVSGYILRDYSSYQMSGGSLSFSQAVASSSENFCNALVTSCNSYYEKLAPFNYITDPTESLYLTDLKSPTLSLKLPEDVNLNGNNFLMHPFTQEGDFSNKNPILLSRDPHVCYTFDDPIFFFSEYANNVNIDYLNNQTNILPDPLLYSLNQPPLFGFNNCTVTQSLFNSGISGSGIYSSGLNPIYSVSSLNNNENCTIYIPFRDEDITIEDEIPDQSFVFCCEVKGDGINPLTHIQVLFSDNIYYQRNSQTSLIEEINPYVNFALTSNGTKNSFNTFASIKKQADDYYRIAVNVNFNTYQRISHVKLNFIENINDERNHILTTNKSAKIKNLQIYKGSLNEDYPDPIPYNHQIKTWAPIDFECIFSYIIHKIHNIDGFFSIGESRETVYSEFIGKKLCIFVPSKRIRDITIDEQNGYRITHLFGGSLDTPGIAQKILFLFIYLLTGVQTSNSNYRKNLYGNKVFATQRGSSFNLFSLATDFIDLYIESENFIEPILSSNATYGQAINRVIKIIVDNKTDFTRRQTIQRNRLFSIPYQLYGLILATDVGNSTRFMFNGTLKKNLTLHIPYGVGRYYPSNTQSASFGFFYETFILKNKANANAFPSSKEEFNKSASQIIDIDPDLTFKRLVFSNSSLNFYKDVNRTVYLENGYFTRNQTQNIAMTGLYTSINKRNDKVWNVEIANDSGMISGNVSIVNPNPSLSSYYLSGISVNDGERRSKYLKIKYTGINYPINEARDRAAIYFYIKSGDTNFSTSNIFTI